MYVSVNNKEMTMNFLISFAIGFAVMSVLGHMGFVGGFAGYFIITKLVNA
jgi:hypothetical protein